MVGQWNHGGVRPPDLEFPDAPADDAEPAVGLGVEVGRQIAGLPPEREMHTLVEVLAGFTVPRDHLVGHHASQELAHLALKRLIVLAQLHAGEVHLDTVTLLRLVVKANM